MAKSSTSLDTTKLDAIIKHLDPNVADAIAKVAFTVEGRTKVNIQQMEAVDTGALLNSVATSLKDGGNVDAAAADARSRNPDAGITELPVPRDNHTAFVGPSVEYANEVHFGSGAMPGRPFLLNAVRDTEKEFYAMIGKVVVDG